MGISPGNLCFLGDFSTPIKEIVRFHIGLHHIDSVADQLEISLFIPLDGGVNPIHRNIGINFPPSLDVCHRNIGNGTSSLLLVPQCHKIIECKMRGEGMPSTSFYITQPMLEKLLGSCRQWSVILVSFVGRPNFLLMFGNTHLTPRLTTIRSCGFPMEQIMWFCSLASSTSLNNSSHSKSI